MIELQQFLTTQWLEDQGDGAVGALLFDYPQVAENFLKPVKKAVNLNCYGASKDFIRTVEQGMSSAATATARDLVP